jgi:hypothetical protein
MKFILCILMILHATVFATFSQSRTYFFPSDGNDNNYGLSIKASWRILDQINRVTFQQGDAILFRSGDTLKGQLFSLGSGSEGKPIIVDRFGDGSMRVINLGEARREVVKLVNQEWWKIQNIEVTSGAHLNWNTDATALYCSRNCPQQPHWSR